MKTQFITYNFKALFSLLPTDLGGRKKPIYNNYRPSFAFNSLNLFTGEISFVDMTELHPGKTAQVQVKLLPSKNIRSTLKKGDSFTIHEGEKIIGSGIIQEIKKND